MVLSNRVAPYRYIHFFRVFFPSWKFFEDIGASPQLFYRLKQSSGDFGSWTPLIHKQPRHLSHLFINPQILYLLSIQSLLQHITTAAAEALDQQQTAMEFSQSVPYQLVKNCVIESLSKNKFTSPVDFQFKVSTVDPAKPEQIIDDVVISDIETLTQVKVK